MTILDFLKYKKYQDDAENLTEKVRDSMLASCVNPEYVDSQIKEMQLIEKTRKMLFESACRSKDNCKEDE